MLARPQGRTGPVQEATWGAGHRQGLLRRSQWGRLWPPCEELWAELPPGVVEGFPGMGLRDHNLAGVSGRTGKNRAVRAAAGAWGKGQSQAREGRAAKQKGEGCGRPGGQRLGGEAWRAGLEERPGGGPEGQRPGGQAWRRGLGGGPGQEDRGWEEHAGDRCEAAGGGGREEESGPPGSAGTLT